MEIQKPLAQRKMPKWSAPKLSLHQCIQDLIQIFQDGGAGIDGTYIHYSANSNKGSLPIIPTGTVYKNEFNYYMDLVNLIDGDEEVNEEDKLEEET
mmetsp:Transcript_30781/g.44208  ORF Transcript_30781/g.44208 Transcript_30781/m.44208 type:complete len:96 (-) Transcript_30781:67-354(-)